MNNGKHDIWETPDKLFKDLNKEFNFNYDLACNSKNCKCIEGSKFDLNFNGLDFIPKNNKSYSIWCNPPYNRIDKPKFIKKCFDLSKNSNVKKYSNVITI